MLVNLDKGIKRNCLKKIRKMNNEIYNTLDIIPPIDKYVEVIDADRNIGNAMATYYPFSVVKREGDERKPYGLRGTVEFHENYEMRWDGGWLINCGFNHNNIGKIVGWRNINK